MIMQKMERLIYRAFAVELWRAWRTARLARFTIGAVKDGNENNQTMFVVEHFHYSTFSRKLQVTRNCSIEDVELC